MEPDSPLIRANGIVVLHAITHIVSHVAVVVDPRNPETDDSVGNTQPFKQVDLFECRITVVDIGYRVDNFFNCLQIFRLMRKPSAQFLYKCFYVHSLFYLVVFGVIGFPAAKLRINHKTTKQNATQFHHIASFCFQSAQFSKNCVSWINRIEVYRAFYSGH